MLATAAIRTIFRGMDLENTSDTASGERRYGVRSPIERETVRTPVHAYY
jgi:hypothetical protein